MAAPTNRVIRPAVFIFLLLAVLAIAACASTNLASITSSGRQFQPENDEIALWAQAHQEERHLLNQSLRYNDPRLLDYLDGIVERLTSQEMAANEQVRYRVRVILDPTLNAFAYPHGSIYIHSGLLVRMQNEHQLAALLGHEMTHVERRHGMRKIRDRRNKSIGFSIAQLIADVALAREVQEIWRKAEVGRAVRVSVLGDLMLNEGMGYAFLAAVNGFGRSMEEEADVGGFEKLVAARYDAREMPKLFEILRRNNPDQAGVVRAYFYGTHPRLAERIESSERLIASRGDLANGPSAKPSNTFIDVMAPLVRDHAKLENAIRAQRK